MSQDRSLAGRVALVTGVSRKRGIGYAIATRLAERGAHLFLHGLASYDAVQPWGADSGGMMDIMGDLRGVGGKVSYVSADFTDTDAPTRVMESALREFGKVDILVANHAYSVNAGIDEITLETLQTHMQVNVHATLMLIQAFAAQYDAMDGGRVIMMTSGQHLGAMPDEIPYIASKGALHQLTASLAAALAPKNITVNTVNPGATDTGYADEDLYQQVLKQQPMGRWGEPDDAARLISWLATDDARWINGQVINSTGAGL